MEKQGTGTERARRRRGSALLPALMIVTVLVVLSMAWLQLSLTKNREHMSSADTKRAFYKALADGLHERLQLRREDVFVNLVEVRKENWSFGNGIAQYAT